MRKLKSKKRIISESSKNVGFAVVLCVIFIFFILLFTNPFLKKIRYDTQKKWRADSIEMLKEIIANKTKILNREIKELKEMA